MMKKNKLSKSSKYVIKLMITKSIILIIANAIAVGIFIYFDKKAGGIDSIWLLCIVTLLCIIAAPIDVFLTIQLYKHVDLLGKSIRTVAKGDTNVYLPTAKPSVFTDIYEDFNKMTAEINTIQTLRTEIMDSISHELKTPVASISSFSKLLLEEDLSEDKKRKCLDYIIKESDKLSDLIKSTLLMSKIDQLEIVTEKKPYNIGRQITECAIAMENEWSAKGIELIAYTLDIMFEGNEGLMESLWQNLLSNAIKYTPPNGSVRVRMADSIDNIVISVSDTGIGMDENVQAHIFERYYQGDESHSTNGHGLGLSIAQRIVRLCDGTITVESREGEGSTFTVTLPK